MKITSFEEFKELARRGTFVPVCKEIVADLLTPVSAFLKIAEHADYAFLLESVEGGEHVGRYSFLGKDPFLILRARDGKTTIERGGRDRGQRAAVHRDAAPADGRLPVAVRARTCRASPAARSAISATAPSSWFEPVLGDLGAVADGADEAGFMLFDTVLAFDHVQHRILIIANARITADDDLESLYQFACAKIQFLERELERNLSHARADARPARCAFTLEPHARARSRSRCAPPRSTSPPATSIRSCCRSGSRRTSRADPFTVYRALRHVNPSPYMYFIRMGGVSVVGSSPEMLVRVEGSRVETHPIAGTRPRGRNDEEDMRLAEELKRNEKERAEHVMLVDLGRNDVGRVCEYGSVRVPQFMGLERFSHVMHLTSIVEGKLADDRDRLDALVSCFPAGHGVGRAEGARDADHPRARAVRPRALRRRGRLPRFRRQPRFLHRHPHGHHVERQGLRAGRRRHRDGFESGGRIRRDARQGAGAAARARAGAGGAVTTCELHDLWFSSSTTTIRSPTTSCSIWASSAPRCRSCATMPSSVDEIAAPQPERIVISPGPGPARAGRRDDGRDPRSSARRRRSSASAWGIRRSARCSAASVVRAAVPMHGKTSTIEHDGRGVFTRHRRPVPRVALSLAGRRRRGAAAPSSR